MSSSKVDRAVIGLLVVAASFYAVLVATSVGFKAVHGIFFTLLVSLLVISRSTRQFVGDFAPLFLFGMLYDALKLVPVAFRGMIHVEGPYRFESALFGFQSGSQHIIPNTFFITHHWAFLDILSGLAYGLHLLVPLLISIRWWFVDRDRSVQFNKALCVANLFCFATYLAFPVAPPWYVTHYGFAPPSWSIPGEAAGLVRFDQLLGINFFIPMYTGLNGYVFGAVPSGHAMFPVLIFLYGASVWRWGRWITLGYLFGVWFAAVYLNHHYMIDLLLGAGIGAVVWTAHQLLLPQLNLSSRFATMTHYGVRRIQAGLKLKSQPPSGTP